MLGSSQQVRTMTKMAKPKADKWEQRKTYTKVEVFEKKNCKMSSSVDKRGANSLKTNTYPRNTATYNQPFAVSGPLYFDHASKYQTGGTDVVTKINLLKKRNELLSAETENLSQKLVEAKEINHALHTELTEAIDELLEYRLMGDKLSKAHQRVAELEAEVARLTTLQREDNDTKNPLLSKRPGLEEENFFLRSQLENLYEKFESRFLMLKEKLHEDSKAVIIENASLKEQLGLLVKKNDSLKSNSDELESKLMPAEGKLKAEGSNMNIHQTEPLENLKMIRMPQDEIEALEDGIRFLKNKVSALEHSNHQIKILESKIVSYEDQIKTLETQLACKDRTNTELGGCVRKLEQEINIFMQQGSTTSMTQEEVRKFNLNKKQMVEELLKLFYKIDRLYTKAFDSSTLSDRLKVYSASMTSGAGFIYDGPLFKCVNKYLEGLTVKLEECVNENSDLKKSNMTYIDNIRDDQTNMKSLKVENKKLKTELATQNCENAGLKDDLALLESRYSDLRLRLEKKMDQVLTSVNSNHEADVKRLEDKINRIVIEKTKEEMFHRRILEFIPDKSIIHIIEKWVMLTIGINQLQQKLEEIQVLDDNPRSGDSRLGYFVSDRRVDGRQDIADIKADIDLKRISIMELNAKLAEKEIGFKVAAPDLAFPNTNINSQREGLMIFHSPDSMIPPSRSDRDQISLNQTESYRFKKNPNNIFTNTTGGDYFADIIPYHTTRSSVTGKDKDYNTMREKIDNMKKKYSLHAES